jgi:hypothetical protein
MRSLARFGPGIVLHCAVVMGGKGLAAYTIYVYRR